MKQRTPLLLICLLLFVLLVWWQWPQEPDSGVAIAPLPVTEPALPLERELTENLTDVDDTSMAVILPAEHVTAVEGSPVAKPERSAEPVTPVVKAPATINGSDSRVKAAVEDINPELLSILAANELLRKFVLTINLFADNDIPTRNRPLAVIAPTFTVNLISPMTEREPAMYRVDQSTYQRFTPLIVAVTSIPPQRLAHYYHAWLPLLEKVQQELGLEDSFAVRLDAAIENILAAESLALAAELVQPNVFYKYQDPILESASPLQKWLWRLGAENQLRIQKYLRELQRNLY